MEKVQVGVIGHTGQLGSPLREILSRHPHAEIVYTESRGWGAKGSPSKIEVVFLALPPGEGGKYIRRFSGKRIIDLSMDHRHNARWTYGLPEIFGAQIKQATKVANPGCYATSVLLGLLPLKGKIEQVSISSTSGISGAGIGTVKLSVAGMRVVREDNFLVYKEGRRHPQIREITRVLGTSNILFVPQRIDTADRGIISTIFAKTREDIGNAAELYAKAYAESPFVRILKSETSLETRRVTGTNYCDIKILQLGEDVVIISALDNLIKGGAGQAIQNFNLMCGFPETAGLI